MKVFLGVLLFWSQVMASQFVIVRHGEGEHNLQNVWSSWTQEEGGADHCLTEKGKTQVAETAKQLRELGFNEQTVGLVLVSPLLRTRETAQILVDSGVCSQQVVEIDERLREPVAKDFEGRGVFEGLNSCKCGSIWEAQIRLSAEYGGEPRESVEKRIASLLDSLLFTWNPSNGHVILVTHGYPSQILFELYEGIAGFELKTAEAKILPLRLKVANDW